MNSLDIFSKFSRSKATKHLGKPITKKAVVYTRVSSKEQADKNLSLESQHNSIVDFATRNGFIIEDNFGGTYESAKTDGRKEFMRMLDYVKKRKGSVTHILVYMLDRFSRTGGGAIQLAEDLREQYGVDIIAVTQPADTSNAGGVLQQSIQFIFSKYDNDVRRIRAMKGMRDKFAKGIWVVRAPIGYDIIRINDDRKIVINETGKKLRKAFVWKSEGLKNAEIMMRLQAIGVPMYKQQLTKIFKNPFYCGLIVHGLLDGEVVEGKHNALISKNLFLKVNNIHANQPGYGVPHKKERDEIPLKVFMICSECSVPFTGYEVKKKALWYYKCRTIGCRCNRSVKEIHSLFMELLSSYSIKPHLTAPLLEKMKLLWKVVNEDAVESEKELKKQLTEIEKKIENIEEGYYVNKEMSKEIFERFCGKLNKERLEISTQLTQSTEKISNPDFALKKALELSTELATVWLSSDIKRKERLQKLVFPQGIVYDRQNNAFRTPKTNIIFELIAGLQMITKHKKREQTDDFHRLSPSAERAGFEPIQ